jgi:hypothetical protein
MLGGRRSHRTAGRKLFLTIWHSELVKPEPKIEDLAPDIFGRPVFRCAIGTPFLNRQGIGVWGSFANPSILHRVNGLGAGRRLG